MDIRKWEAFIDSEMERGVNLAILIGGEPTLCLDRVEAFYKTVTHLLCHKRPHQGTSGPIPPHDGGYFSLGGRRR